MNIGPNLKATSNDEIAQTSVQTRNTAAWGYDLGYPAVSASCDYYKFNKGMPTNNIIKSGGPAFFGSGGEVLTQQTYLGFKSDDGVFRRNLVTNPAQSDSSTYNNNGGYNHSGLTLNSLSSDTTHLQFSFDWYLITPYQRHSNTHIGLRGYVRVSYTDGSAENHFWNTTNAFPGSSGNSSNDNWNNDSSFVGSWNKVGLVGVLNSSKTPSSISAFYIYMDRAIQGEGVLTNFNISEHTSFPVGTSRFVDTPSAFAESQTLMNNVNSYFKAVTFDSSLYRSIIGDKNMTVTHNRFGWTWEFDGTDDKINGNWDTNNVNTLNVDNNDNNRSWEVIVKTDVAATNTAYGIWGHKAGTGCSHYCNGGIRIYNKRFQFVWYDNSAYQFLSDPNDDIVVGQFYHVVGVFNATDDKPRLYVNGSLVATFGSATTMDYSSGMEIYDIGWNSKSGGMHYFNGAIPVCKFYKSLLSDDDVLQNFNAYKKRFNI